MSRQIDRGRNLLEIDHESALDLGDCLSCSNPCQDFVRQANYCSICWDETSDMSHEDYQCNLLEIYTLAGVVGAGHQKQAWSVMSSGYRTLLRSYFWRCSIAPIVGTARARTPNQERVIGHIRSNCKLLQQMSRNDQSSVLPKLITTYRPPSMSMIFSVLIRGRVRLYIFAPCANASRLHE